MLVPGFDSDSAVTPSQRRALSYHFSSQAGGGDGDAADLRNDCSEKRRCTQEEEDAVHLRPVAVTAMSAA